MGYPLWKVLALATSHLSIVVLEAHDVGRSDSMAIYHLPGADVPGTGASRSAWLRRHQRSVCHATTRSLSVGAADAYSTALATNPQRHCGSATDFISPSL